MVNMPEWNLKTLIKFTIIEHCAIKHPQQCIAKGGKNIEVYVYSFWILEVYIFIFDSVHMNLERTGEQF